MTLAELMKKYETMRDHYEREAQNAARLADWETQHAAQDIAATYDMVLQDLKKVGHRNDVFNALEEANGLLIILRILCRDRLEEAGVLERVREVIDQGHTALKEAILNG